MPAKSYTWYAPPAVPSSVSVSVVAGGSLPVAKTYYIKVISVKKNGTFSTGIECPEWSMSGLTVEFTVTTTAVNKTIRITGNKDAKSGIVVFISTSSGNYYTGNTRVYSTGYYEPTLAPDASTSFKIDIATLTNKTAYGCNTEVKPSTTTFVGGFVPETYGEGYLLVSGGTLADPITFKNIYDYAVASITNYDRWFYFKNGLFAHNAGIRLDHSVETHFAEAGTIAAAVYSYSPLWIYGTSEDGSLAIGDYFTARQCGRNGFAWFSGCATFREFYNQIDVMCSARPFDLYYKSLATKHLSASAIWANNYINCVRRISGGASVRIKAAGGETYIYNLTGGMRDLDNAIVSTFYTRYYNPAFYQDVFCYYVNAYRMAENDSNVVLLDRFKFAFGNYIIYDQEPRVDSNGKYYVLDPVLLGTQRESKIPLIAWHAQTTGNYTNEMYVYYSVGIQVTDFKGNDIAGAKLTIYDKDGNVCKDWNPVLDTGASIDGLVSNGDGWFGVDSFVLTSASTTTITDTSKNWTTDQWKYRRALFTNGYAIGQEVKIASNTATVATFDFAIGVGLNINNRGIFLPWIKRSKTNHKAGTGNGSGEPCSDETDYSPFTLKIEADGYETYTEKFYPLGQIRKTIKLLKKASKTTPERVSQYE